MYVIAEMSSVRIIVNPVVVSNSKKSIQITVLPIIGALLMGRNNTKPRGRDAPMTGLQGKELTRPYPSLPIPP